MTLRTAGIALASTLLLAACNIPSLQPEPEPVPTSSRSAEPSWPVQSRLHIDLWLHGFATLEADTTLVPYFRRDYRARMAEVKRRAKVMTQLDVERDRLREMLVANPRLTNAQFLALYFSTWDAFQRAIDLFLRAGGDPRRAGSEQDFRVISAFAQYFPTSSDQEWLRIFTNALRDEHDRYYRSWWTQRQAELAPVLARVDTLWTRQVMPKLRPYLSGTRSPEGNVYLALPLDGEGRTLTGASRLENAIAVGFPDSAGAAEEAIYAVVHEMAGRAVSPAVNDNVTPAEQRAGAVDRYTTMGLVRGGALLLQRMAPEMVEGYERYYLRAANAAVPTGGAAAVEAAFARTFPLPAPVLEAIRQQIESVMSGI
ncbi:MAG TPA: hypothetical protein VFS05_16595 [Gemmatimonadaceae bacterium]|nr:hypothetical protein [Gemmatimonadaceae bacterium]